MIRDREQASMTDRVQILENARLVLPDRVEDGWLAVAMRVGSTGQPHRATVDIDLVTTETDPAAVEILADARRYAELYLPSPA